MIKQRKIALRYKLLALLALLPIIFLALYLSMATNLFYQDKKAYVFDSSVLVAKSLSAQIRLELLSVQKTLEPIIESIDYSNFKLSQRSLSFFNAQKNIEHLIIYKRQEKSDLYKIMDRAFVNGREVREPVLDPDGLVTMQKIAISKGIIMSDYMAASRFFLVMQSHNPPRSPNHFISLAIYKAPDLFEAFATPTMYKSFLISKSRFISMRPKFVRKSQDRIKVDNFDFFSTIVTQVFPEGTTEVKTPSGQSALISFSDVGIGDMVVAAVIDKKAAFQAVDNLVSKSLLFFLAIVCIAILVSIIASLSLISTISKLLVATEQIGDGNFNIDINLNSRDEFGELARRFVTMAQKVSSLLKSTAEQARMENELEMVRVVQENLFPKANLDFGAYRIVSYFEPASECGGDWFHYSEIAGKIYLWIGDATGHGAPAALITSAAKSAASIIEATPGLSPSQAMEVLNHAIYSTAHGSVLMTFFLGVIDPESGTLLYSNASHEFPYIVPAKEGLKKKDLIPLCDTQTGKRLGESSSSTYEEGTYQLQEGDTIIFYTDGIIDLRNEEGEELGERNFIKAIVESSTGNPHVAGKVDKFKKIVSEHRKKASLVDDITMFWVQYK